MLTPSIPPGFSPFDYRFPHLSTVHYPLDVSIGVRDHLAVHVAFGAAEYRPGSTERIRLDMTPIEWLDWHSSPGFRDRFIPPIAPSLVPEIGTERHRAILPGWVVDWCRGLALAVGGDGAGPVDAWLRAAILSRRRPDRAASGTLTTIAIDPRVLAAIRLFCPARMPVEVWVSGLPRATYRARGARSSAAPMAWRRGPAGGLGWGVDGARDVESRVVAALEARGTSLDDIDPMAGAHRRLLHSPPDRDP